MILSKSYKCLLFFFVINLVWPDGINATAENNTKTAEARLSRLLHDSSSFRVDFTQSREIAGFNRPLKSEGTLLFVRDRGVIWSTHEPVETVVVILPGKIYQEIKGERDTLPSSAQPFMRTVSDMLLALYGGDIAKLKDIFTISVVDHGESSSHLRLMPKQFSLRQAVRHIDLFGDSAIEEVRITESEGNINALIFGDRRELDVELSEIERSYLEID